MTASPPPAATLDELRAAAATCTGCDLYRSATQTVFGEGAEQARVMLVGEQPGDVEDATGRPFVGPAGKILDRALDAAGIERAQVYVTNAVKHFKWKPQGARRLHQKPNAAEVAACKPWLLAEIERLRPAVVVALGATAAQSLLGPQFRVTKQRGELLSGPLGVTVMATVHPSSILRGPPEERETALAGLVADLARVPRCLQEAAGG